MLAEIKSFRHDMRNAHFCKNIKKVYIEFSLLQQWLSEQATNPSQLSKVLKSDTFGKE